LLLMPINCLQHNVIKLKCATQVKPNSVTVAGFILIELNRLKIEVVVKAAYF